MPRVPREWYGYHFPELVKVVPDNFTYCRLAQLIGNRKELSEESLERLEEVVMDAGKAQAILDASRSSMGQNHTCLVFGTMKRPFLAHPGPSSSSVPNTGGQSSSLINLRWRKHPLAADPVGRNNPLPVTARQVVTLCPALCPTGMDISPIDLINIERFSNRVVSLAEYRLELQEYLRSKMGQVAPNLAALIGEVVSDDLWWSQRVSGVSPGGGGGGRERERKNTDRCRADDVLP